jgi:hypothetical protein
MKNIDEVIADAMAEEEVRNEIEKQAEEDFKNDAREVLKDHFKEVIDSRVNNVTIPLSEYLALKFKEMDLGRLIGSIYGNLELTYSKEGLRLDESERVVDTFRVLYPNMYEDMFKELLASEVKEDE